VESSQRDTLINRALLYPYLAPEHSFVYSNGVNTPLQRWLSENKLASWQDAIATLQQNNGVYTPVIAYGSNRSPEQLVRKYGEHTTDVILSIAATLHHHDIVRSAHFTSYSTLAATFTPSQGTSVSVFVQFLSSSNLQILHRTEALGRNYRFVSFPAHCITIKEQPVDAAMIYEGLHGFLYNNGSPLAFAELSATNRIFPARSQTEVLTDLHQHLNIQISFPHWLMKIAKNEAYRKHLTTLIKTIT